MGKILVAYASKSGTAAHCAALLAHRLHAACLDLTRETPDLSAYDTVIVGGSIRMGLLHKKAKLFMEEREAELLTKRLGFFVCCCLEKDLPQYFQQNILPSLRRQAVFCEGFGGQLDRKKLHGFDRCMATMLQRSPLAGQLTLSIHKDRIKEAANLLLEEQPLAE